MPIQVKCKCGNKFGAPSKYAGKKVKCPACSNPLVVPAANDAAKAKPAEAVGGVKKIAVKCKCGKSFGAKPELLGKTVRCPGCNEPLKIQAPQKRPAVSQAQASPLADTDDVFQEIGLGGPEGPGRKCPECKRPMGPEDILCINCGYNEKLGRKMTVQRPITQADREQAHQEKTLTGGKSEQQSKKKGWLGRKKK